MGHMLPFIPQNAPVVVVDDDPSVCDALLLLLRIDGFEAASFGDGESFFESLTSSTPSCVILDLQLPGRSGLAVLKQLSDMHFAPPVFVISGVRHLRPVRYSDGGRSHEARRDRFSGKAFLCGSDDRSGS